MDRIFEKYRIGMDKNQVRNLNITKQESMSLFIYPRMELYPLVAKRCICMDWCIHQKIKDNWKDMWFIDFEKHHCNNKEIPLYFLQKLWVDYILGHHLNYFNIGDL
jgi:hypothetical protein